MQSCAVASRRTSSAELDAKRARLAFARTNATPDPQIAGLAAFFDLHRQDDRGRGVDLLRLAGVVDDGRSREIVSDTIRVDVALSTVAAGPSACQSPALPISAGGTAAARPHTSGRRGARRTTRIPFEPAVLPATASLPRWKLQDASIGGSSWPRP
jgi:hypothetical protein